MSPDIYRPIIVIATIITVIVVLNLLGWRVQGKPPTTFGSASWMVFWEAYGRKLLRPGGFLAGDWEGLCPVWLRFQHAITFGPTGSGKGTTAIIPNLLSQDHVFLVDPGGENTAVVIDDWRARGLSVHVINPFGLLTDAPHALPQHRFNPLALLRTDSDALTADSKLIAEMLITRSGNEVGSAKFFIDATESLLRALIVHIVTALPEADRHLGTLSDFLNADAENWDALLKAMKANTAAAGLVTREANKLERREHQAPEEFSAIMSTAQEALSWIDDPLMREALSQNEVSFDALKGHSPYEAGAAIAVVLPIEYLSSHSALTRLALSCAVLTLRRAPVAQSAPLFILDEAASLGRVGPLTEWLATMRRYGARFWPIFQDVAQLKAIYRDTWNVFFANCDVRQFLGMADLTTAQVVRDTLGTATINTTTKDANGKISVSQAQRPLMTVDELLQMPGNLQIVFYKNLAPMLIVKTPYWRRPEFEGRIGINPFIGQPMRVSKRRYRRMENRIRMALAFVLYPHWTVVLTYVVLGCASFGYAMLAAPGPS